MPSTPDPGHGLVARGRVPVMGWWEARVVPRLADWSLRGHEVGDLRAEACDGLRGQVLELGFGGGLNTRFYPAGVTSVAAVEPSDLGWSLSERRRERSATPVERVGLDGQHLDAPDASYDAVLATFTLCTIPDPALALREVRRVLRPGGSFHFLEHGRSPGPGGGRGQQRVEPVQRRVAGGCHLTRDVTELISAAGLEVTSLRTDVLAGPSVSRPWTFCSLGRAVRTP